MENKNITLYQGYDLQDLYKQVVVNSRSVRAQIQTSIKKMIQMMTTSVDVQIMGGEITNFLNVLVKNDELLIKLASVVAKLNGVNFRMMSISDDGQLSDTDKKLALAQAQKDMTSILSQLRSQYKTQNNEKNAI